MRRTIAMFCLSRICGCPWLCPTRWRHMLATRSAHCPVSCKFQQLCQVLSRHKARRSASSKSRQFAGASNMAPKRKAEKGETAETPEKKPRAKKEKPLAEPHTGDDGWTVVPPSLLFKHSDLKQSSKIAAFDLDGTLVGTKGRAQFPTDENDWRFFNKTVPKELQAFHEKGYKIVIFSNQAGIKSALGGKQATKVKGRISNMLAEAGVPAQVLVATGQDQYRKPEIGMWEYFVEHGNDGKQPDLKDSFFVGDAAGRVGDFAASDKEFAANVGLPFKLPEDIFGEGTVKKAAPTGVAEGGVNHNEAMCTAFKALADIHEAKGGNNMFAARANTKIAGILAAYPKKVESGKELKSVQGVGKGTMDKIDEFIKTGTLAALSEAEGAVEGGDAPEKQEAVKGKATNMAMKFL